MPDLESTEADQPDLRPGRGDESKGDRASYLGFAAHEMRNPLSTALWSIELLDRLSPDERKGQRGQKLAGMALRSLNRLRLLIEDHFMAERLAVEGIPRRLEPVPLRGAVQEALAAQPSLAGAADVESGLVAFVDKSLLMRALEAVLATAGRGDATLRIEGLVAPDEVGLRIAGAPPQPDALLMPQKGMASDPKGRALGLHMASAAVRAMGGTLRIAADAYVLTLPVWASG